MRPFVLTHEQLLTDLYVAYYDARRHKRSKPYQQRFEARLEDNLNELCDELFERRYRARPSTCFIITDPKRREVFAADFRDRIVHHLYYNYTHELFERTFIQDSYSCIKGRGTHYGIDRMEQHIRRESQNYTEPCWVLKMDVKGYFMHIDRRRLLDITMRQLERMAVHRIGKTTWGECIDMDFLRYLTEEIVMLNPTEGCHVKGDVSDWETLPHDKSLFHSPVGCGLPIGNLTSQLFSNVYMNELDQYMKRTLRCRHYGRYVDDFYVVSADREWLCSLREPVACFLREHLGLRVNENKTIIRDVRIGVSFLGAYLKPHRRYIDNVSLRRMQAKVARLEETFTTAERLRASLNSFLGVLSHYRTYRIRQTMFAPATFVYRYGYYRRGMSRFCALPHS